jgi:hypothetical protein
MRHWGRRQEELEMDALKRFSLALMAAALVVGTTPAFSQTRDTRPTEPDRPTTEQGEKDSSEERADPAQSRRLPKATPGTDCEAHADGNGAWEVTVANESGNTLAAGTVLTLYLQPGNVQKTFKLETDWYPGTEIDVTVKAGDFELGARCVVKIMPKRADTGKPGLGGVPWYAQGPVGFTCLGLTVYSPDHAYITLVNDYAVVIPAGTKIVFQLPDGQWYVYILEEDWGLNVPLKVSVHLSEGLEQTFIDWQADDGPRCAYTKVETGYSGPAVEEQGSVPQIDPSKLP